MVLLSIAIAISLLVTVGLQIGIGVWLNKTIGLAMRVITFGVLGYPVVQAFITLMLSGYASLVKGATLELTKQNFTA